MTTPRARRADRRYFGVAEALVVDTDDPEREGRVRLVLPWFDESMVTDWCRVSQLHAGNGYGSLFVPHEGDEVLVGFVHGDMRFPMVLGGLYNGQDKPASHRAQDKDQKLIRTRHGHELLLDDSPQAEAVRLRTAAGHEVHLDDPGGKVVVKTAAGASVTLEGTTITVDGGGGVTVRGSSVTVESADIRLGSGARPALVLSDLLGTIYNAHVHTLTPTGATSPPVVPLVPQAVASQIVKVT
jgi:phage baseplate assembly protein V